MSNDLTIEIWYAKPEVAISPYLASMDQLNNLKDAWKTHPHALWDRGVQMPEVPGNWSLVDVWNYTRDQDWENNPRVYWFNTPRPVGKGDLVCVYQNKEEFTTCNVYLIVDKYNSWEIDISTIKI